MTNNLALQHLRQMQEGDLALIYHSGSEKRIVGMARVTCGAYAHPEAKDEKFVVCDLGAPLPIAVTLVQIKAVPELSDWAWCATHVYQSFQSARRGVRWCKL